MTYKALGRSIANYVVPVWSINASESNIGKIQRAQNEALRIITGSHKCQVLTTCTVRTPTEGALRIPSTHPVIRNANHKNYFIRQLSMNGPFIFEGYTI